MSVRTYDPTQLVVTFGGIPISGFADGTYISVERDEETFTKVTGADGTTARSKTANRSGAVTLTLLQTSLSNDYLSGVALLDELSNSGVLPLIVKDLSGTTIIFAKEAWVQKPAAFEGAKEVTEREWILDTGDMDVFIGGNLNAS